MGLPETSKDFYAQDVRAAGNTNRFVSNVLRDITVVIPAKGAQDIAHAKKLVRRLACPYWIIEDKPYGTAIKEGIWLTNTEYVATMDADGQHTIEALEDLIRFAIWKLHALESRGMVIGLRQAWENRYANVALNLIASGFANRWVPDLGSGLRIFHRDTAYGYRSILPNGFDFNTALTMAFAADHLPIDWFGVNVAARKWGTSSVRPWRDGLRALWQIIRIGSACRTRKVRAWIRRA